MVRDFITLYCLEVMQFLFFRKTSDTAQDSSLRCCSIEICNQSIGLQFYLTSQIASCLLRQGCANFFNCGPNSNKDNIVRVARFDRIIFYQLLI